MIYARQGALGRGKSWASAFPFRRRNSANLGALQGTVRRDEDDLKRLDALKNQLIATVRSTAPMICLSISRVLSGSPAELPSVSRSRV